MHFFISVVLHKGKSLIRTDFCYLFKTTIVIKQSQTVKLHSVFIEIS